MSQFAGPGLAERPRPPDQAVGQPAAQAPYAVRDASRRLSVVGWCALVAGLARLPGALWPIRPDEAGFTLVARAWDPGPGRLYGPYWVDRPPLLLWLIRLTDWVGGPLFVRVVGAVGCAVLVLLAAGTAREVATLSGLSGRAARRAVKLTAIGTTAVTSNAMIDLVAAKGEVLGLPWILAAIWLALRARVNVHRAALSTLLAVAAGVSGAIALGLKQNQVSGLAFGGIFLIVEVVRRRIRVRDLVRLGAAMSVGAAIPIGVMVGWAVWAGVSVRSLVYAVYGFRADAMEVIHSQPANAPHRRAGELAAIFVLSGLVVLFGLLVARAARLARVSPSVTIAAFAVLAVDLSGLALGGSYWRPYLFGLVPSAVLALSLLACLPRRPARTRARRTIEVTVALITVSAVASNVGWVVAWATGLAPPTEVYTGQAIHRAAAPTDTLVVFGGRADLQMAAGLASPYPYLWSLPGRTLDPGSRQLSRLLAGPNAPTWFVEWVPLGAWDERSKRNVDRVLERRYEVHGNACNDRPVYLLKGQTRPGLHLGCGRPYRPRRPGDAGLGPQATNG